MQHTHTYTFGKRARDQRESGESREGFPKSFIYDHVLSIKDKTGIYTGHTNHSKLYTQ